MTLDKSTVTDKLRADGDHDRAHHAECVLPKHVDTEADAALLHQFGMNVADLTEPETDH